MLKEVFILAMTISFAVGSSPVVPIQKCEKLFHPKSVVLCQDAGYNYTSPFPDINGQPFQEVKSKQLGTYLRFLTTCSKYSASIFCSLYFPKCVEHLPRPVLPCQSVCNDFVHSCASVLDRAALRGLFSAICALLPLYDGNPDTCFLPDGFNVSRAASGVDKSTCHKVSIPKCQVDLHYNFTFISNDTQSLSNAHLLDPVIASSCSSDMERFTCFTRVPPCSVNKTIVQVPCKSMCQKIIQSCSAVFKKYSIPTDCDFLYPDKQSSTGMCTLTEWPAPTTVAPPPTPKPGGCKRCQKITIKECAKAGYHYTFHFKDINGKSYQEFASTALEMFIKLLKCSPKYSQTILCSMYLPKCDVEKCNPKPILPCRRVCHEFVRTCEDDLRISATHGLFVGLCDLLPWNNTAETPCFLPPGFKPTSEVYQRDVCFPISNIHNTCTNDFSYNSTFIPPSDQVKSKVHALLPIIDSKCSSHAEQFFCYTRIPPCSRKGELSVALPCRSMCKEVMENCKGVFEKYRIPVADCDFLLPDADGGDDGICRSNKFPIPFRHFKHPKHDDDDHRGHGLNGGLIAAIIIIVLVVLIVVAAFAVLYYRKRKQTQPFEPKVLHDVGVKD